MRQLGFKLLEQKNVKVFGGSLLKGNPKIKRPISTKKACHLVMRSEFAKGSQSFLRWHRKVVSILNVQAERFGVKIYRIANGGNHLHIIILPRSRYAFHGFIRSTSGLIARLVLGCEKGRASGVKFWDARPFTRILDWGKDYKGVYAYLLQNTLEAWGFAEYRPRTARRSSA